MNGNFDAINVSNLHFNDIENELKNCGEALVNVKNIHKIYKKIHLKNLFLRNKKIVEYYKVIDGVSFNIYKNEIFGILGHNGAGKSTLFKIMTGLIKPEFGDVYYEGLSIKNNINEIRNKIGIIFNLKIMKLNFIKDFLLINFIYKILLLLLLLLLIN